MKKIISLLLAVSLITVAFAGCGGKREAFNCDLKDYVTLGDYKSIIVDKNGEDYQKYYNDYYQASISKGNFYEQKTTGAVKDGDIVNINYVGKKDGVAFEGGTANGADLVIGSNSFIDGFEKGLIGAEVGSTVNLNLKFPDNYSSTDLAGKDVVFTVTVNHIKSIPQIDDNIAVKLGFKTADELTAELDKYATENSIADQLVKMSSIASYPKADQANYDEVYNKNIEQYKTAVASYNAQYGTNYDLDTYMYLSSGMTSSQFKSFIYKQMESIMIFYAVLDDAGLTCTDEDINAVIASLVTESMSEAQVKENYEAWAIEVMAVQTKVLDYLKGAVTIR